MRPLLVTILCVREIWYGSSKFVHMYHIFHLLAKQKVTPPPQKKSTSPYYFQKPETFV